MIKRIGRYAYYNLFLTVASLRWLEIKNGWIGVDKKQYYLYLEMQIIYPLTRRSQGKLSI
jgi:hypothetical protein